MTLPTMTVSRRQLLTDIEWLFSSNEMIDEALTYDDWIIAMEEELHLFTRNDV